MLHYAFIPYSYERQWKGSEIAKHKTCAQTMDHKKHLFGVSA